MLVLGMLIDTINCICLVIQKTAFEKMIDLDVEEIVSAMKIMYLDAEVFVEKIMVALVFEIDIGSIYTAMTLMNQDTIMLLQIVILRSEI